MDRSSSAAGLCDDQESLDQILGAFQTILVVEDDQSLRDYVSLVLEAEGYRVLQADRGESALRVLCERTPDLIISDIVMPGMDGLELLERVRANVAWCSIPFVFLTAKAGRSDVRYGMGLGADDYLPKPFELAELLSAVEARLVRAAATRAAILGEGAGAWREAHDGSDARHAEDEDGAAVQTLVAKGDLLRLEGRYAEAMTCSSQALALVSGTNGREGLVRAMALRNAGLCLIRLCKEEAGQRSLEEALRLCDGLGSPHDVATVHSDLGLAYEIGGDFEGAVDQYEAALRTWEELGTLGPWADTLDALGAALCVVGRYDDALPVLHEAVAKAQQAGNGWVEAHARVGLGDLQRDLGALGLARVEYAQAREIAERGGLRAIVTHALNGEADILRQQGDWPEARARLLEALAQPMERQSEREIGRCHTSLGIVASEAGDLAAARTHLDQAIALLRTESCREELSRAYMQRAQVAFLAGQKEIARAGVERALALATQLASDRFLVVDGQRLQPLLRYAEEQGVAGGKLPGLLLQIDAHRARVAAWIEHLVPAEHQPTLRIHALGQVHVEVDGVVVHWRGAQTRELFFYLLQHPQGLRRDQIGCEFWPDHLPEKARDNFHVNIYHLRQAVAREVVTFEYGLYRIGWPGGYWYDAVVFETLLDEARDAQEPERAISLIEEALKLYGGDFLETADGIWASVEREHLHQRYLSALDELAALYARGGSLQRAIEAYQALLTQDPCQEEAHRQLMRTYHQRGNRAGAIEQYQVCTRILRDELGLRPAPETEALYQQIVA